MTSLVVIFGFSSAAQAPDSNTPAKTSPTAPATMRLIGIVSLTSWEIGAGTHVPVSPPATASAAAPDRRQKGGLPSILPRLGNTCAAFAAELARDHSVR